MYNMSMFTFAFFVGIYSYIIFFLGITDWLYKDVMVWVTGLFWGGVSLWWFRKLNKNKEKVKLPKLSGKLFTFLLLLFILQLLVNLIGVLGPELAFDALWYHLTLPKIYLDSHSIFFIPGGLLYYSVMPKLGEMLYIGGLSFGNEVIPKLIHFSFGLLTCFALYKLSRKFFSPLVSIIAVVIFYSNLVVGWQSITAYVDLTRALFEVMALWAFVNWLDKGKTKWLIWSALMLGFAITTKLLAIGSLIMFALLIFWKTRNRNAVKKIVMYTLIALSVPLPWFIFSYINTGNPVYPFFTEIYKVSPEPLSFVGFFREVGTLFIHSADPISPIYVIFLPLFILLFKKIKNNKLILAIGTYSILSIIIWYFTPRTGGGRFILPYLPALSILCAFLYSYLIKNIKLKYIGKFLICLIIFVSLISIGYRFMANIKYLPIILGKESKDEFLEKHLNFSFGDFYDYDGYFKNNIKPTDKVLLYGFHNLYYINFPFVDSSWLKPSDVFNYIATQNTNLPMQYKNWKLVYENEKTMVKLYKP